MISRMLNDFSPLLRLQDEMNRLFEDFSESTPAARQYGQQYPAINLWEDADAAYVESELPGLAMEDLDITVSGRDVTIAGERKSPGEQNGANWHRRERGTGRFSRTLTLPWELDADKVEAHLRDGVLMLRLPKSESAKPKKVKVLTA